MKSKIRRVIDKFVASGPKQNWAPTYIGNGAVFVVPARASQDSQIYIVSRIVRHTAKKTFVEWMCSCKGFWYSEKDYCRHIDNIRQQWDKLGAEVA